MNGEKISEQKVNMFMMTNQKFFPDERALYLREQLEELDERKFNMISSVTLQDPMTMFLISLFLGGLGIDRFMMEETGMGVLKLLTFGCFGVLTIVDMASIQRRVKEANFKKVMRLLNT